MLSLMEIRPDSTKCSLSVCLNCFHFKLTLSQTSRVCGQMPKYMVSLVFARFSICLLIFRSVRSNKYHFWSNPSQSVVSFSKTKTTLCVFSTVFLLNAVGFHYFLLLVFYKERFWFIQNVWDGQSVKKYLSN